MPSTSYWSFPEIVNALGDGVESDTDPDPMFVPWEFTTDAPFAAREEVRKLLVERSPTSH